MVMAEFLEKIPIFSSLSSSQLNELAQHWTLLEKKPQDILFRTGDTADNIYIIQQGSVFITINAIHDEPLILSILNAGDMFGELTLFDTNKRTANAVVNEKTTLLVMSRDTF